MGSQRDRYRSFRRWWWWRPGVLLPAVVLFLLAIPMIWWISTYESDMAVAMFVITYVALLVIVTRMMRNAILEPHIRVHERVLRQEETALAEHRRSSYAALARTERDLLAQGEVTPVLDVWRIDPNLRQRHAFISDTVTCLADPRSRELWIRVHLSDDWTLQPKRHQGPLLTREVATYLRLLSSDPSAQALKRYVSSVVLELRVRRDDAGLAGTYAPAFSLYLPWNDLQRAAPTMSPPFIPGDCRFAGGEEIEPHRTIPAGAGTATK